MTHTMAIKLIRTHKRITRQQFTERFGRENQDTLFNRVSSPYILMNQLVDIFDALDYQLVFQPKGKETLPEKCYRIQLSDYNLNT